MSNKAVVLSWDAVKAVGKTIIHEGEPSIIVKTIPPDCIVLFISKTEWASIKKQAEV